jgi:hypothetical protein
MFSDRSRGPSLREKGLFYLVGLAIVLLFFSISPESVSAKTWYIKADGTGDAPTIQAGVDSAVVGDTVMVGPGTYADTTQVMVAGTLRPVNVHIQKQISLIGEQAADHPLIDGVHSYVGIFVDSVESTVLIGHLRLKGTAFLASVSDCQPSETGLAREYPARIRSISSSITVDDVIVSNDHDGVFLSNSTADIHNSELHTLAMAILPYDGSDATVCNNYIFDGPFGIECIYSTAIIVDNIFGAPPPAGAMTGVFCGSSIVEVRGNTMRWAAHGFDARGSQVVLDDNRFFDMVGTCVHLASSDATITNNIFYKGPWAIYSRSGTTGEISNNTIDGYNAGIVSELGTSQVIRKNIITRGFWGIECLGSDLTVECNNIFDMSSGLYYWDCGGEPGVGNFSADPEFCGIDDSGNYFLQADSPCAPGNHPDGYDCGLIGALPVNCGQVETKRNTWGAMKEAYRKDGKP